MKFDQENIKGRVLELSIFSQVCDKGRCEEYISKYRDRSSYWTAAISIIFSLLVVFLVSESNNFILTVVAIVLASCIALRPLTSVASG